MVDLAFVMSTSTLCWFKFRMSRMRRRRYPRPILHFFECVRLSVKKPLDRSNRAAVNLRRDFHNQMTDEWRDYDVCDVVGFRVAVK